MILNNSNLFVTDFDGKSGNGHLQRCIRFSKIFSKNYKNYFLTKKSFNIPDKNSLNIQKLDKKTFFKFIIIDSYKIKNKTLLELKKRCQFIININDEYKRAFNSDFLINYSEEEKKNKQKLIKHKINTKLLGKKYNFVFPNKIIKSNFKFNSIKIFIYLGTKVQKEIIDNIFNKLLKFKFKFKIILISRYQYKKNKKINIIIKKKISKKDFLREIDKSDIIICSTGVTVFEAISAKKIIFGVPISKNQLNNYYELKRLKLIKPIKFFSNKMFRDDFLKKQKDYLIKNHYLRSYNHLFNIKQYLFPLKNSYNEKFQIVEFNLSKKNIIYLYKLQSYQNRKFFINKNKFTLNSHYKYINNFLKNPLNLIFFIKFKRKNIGYIKLTIVDKNYDCSIMLDQRYRNKGFSSEALKYFKNNELFFSYRLNAKILSQNKNSIKVFQKAGFKKNKDLFIINEK